MKKYICIALLISCNAYAGFKGLTHHSRANCGGFNESITWDFTTPLAATVYSTHHYLPGKKAKVHYVQDSQKLARRIAAYHVNEGYSGWYVVGDHYWIDPDTGDRNYIQTRAQDCSIYNGWWDK